MDILRRLRALWGARPAGPPGALVFSVQCDHCGEVVQVRVDPRWDLSQEFDGDLTGHRLSKDVLGVRCNRLMRLRVSFDRSYRITATEVDGGRLVAGPGMPGAS
ncbi:MAG: hypothetical protein QN155_02060 [Armatimonadota bacterium]|nr:hypothetical protein [Armatimonadota bacterium]MDR7403208.1 hypothetical protein [Armatimonadota bacterium]